MKRLLLFCILLTSLFTASAQNTPDSSSPFTIRGFHLDLRIQVMTMDALKSFALKLHNLGINTLIMEWEGSYPFQKHPLIANRYAYTRDEITAFISYCKGLNINVIPLQQSFGHVEYILRNDRYKDLREDQKDFSQVCPLQTVQDSALFTDLYTDLASTHTSKYIHIGGDETYLLGHDERCKARVAKEGKSKLYIDYIRMLCNIVIRLGKTPVLWADIALKYPDAIKLLPKSTVFIDWNYGWDLNHFGDHQKLLQSGYEIWGAPALRSSPDNYFLTCWEKHFKNIHDFIPEAAKMGYKGMILTSWSTSGQYSPVFESENEMTEEYAIRHVYPLSGFSILLAAYAEAIQSDRPLDINDFITGYCKDKYGFNPGEATVFRRALGAAPFEILHGEVLSKKPMSVKELSDSANASLRTLDSLKPHANIEEFAHYRLMAAIRANYLQFQVVLQKVNSPGFSEADTPRVLQQLNQLIAKNEYVNQRFAELNRDFLQPAEIKEENELRIARVRLLYDRLARSK
jgi:hexosaminidase